MVAVNVNDPAQPWLQIVFAAGAVIFLLVAILASIGAFIRRDTMPTAAGFFTWQWCWTARSRKIVGWSMAIHLRAELVVDALQMAVRQRR